MSFSDWTMSSSRGKQSKKAKLAEVPVDLKSFDFGIEEEKKEMSCSEEDIREGNLIYVNLLTYRHIESRHIKKLLYKESYQDNVTLLYSAWITILHNRRRSITQALDNMLI